MKNKIKLIGVIAFVAVIGLLLAGCGKKGGTLEVSNTTSSAVTVLYAFGDSSSVSLPTSGGTSIPATEKKDFSTDKDGNYIISYTGQTVPKTGTIKGDETIKISIPW
jgi:hypothetical protein